MRSFLCALQCSAVHTVITAHPFVDMATGMAGAAPMAMNMTPRKEDEKKLRASDTWRQGAGRTQ